MRFYNMEHAHYCGIDLHAKKMYVCIINRKGTVVLHENMPAQPGPFLRAIRPYRKNMVVGVECMFTWYWLADLCARENIPFVLGHALYMRAVHGAKAKNDRVDSEKIARLIRSGMFPMASVCPEAMRATRDLLRRRMRLMRKRAELLVHIENTNSQYNLPPVEGKLSQKCHRAGVAERFEDPSARKSVELDLALLQSYDALLLDVESFILKTAREEDGATLARLRTVPGVGRLLSLVIFYEVYDVGRFASVQDFASYCRLVKPARESGGKVQGYSGKKIGNAHLKWAFSEAAVLFLRQNPDGERYHARLVRKHGKPKALTVLAHKLARTVYYMLQRRTVFDMKKFIAG